MTVSGRRLPFAGIAEAIDCVIATKGWSRPNSAIQARGRERPFLDRIADIALKGLIVQRDNRFDCLLSQL